MNEYTVNAGNTGVVDGGYAVSEPFLLVCRAAVMATGLMRTVPMLLSKTN